METGLHVVLGSTGGAGNAIARALVAGDHEVRAVNRSGRADLPPGLELARADISSPGGATEAVAGAAVVYMAAQPAYHRWAQEFPQMLGRVIDACASVGAKLVMVDNLYGYGQTDGPISEQSPPRATDAKGVLRARMADQLFDAHRAGRLRVTIGRASDYFGPRAPNSALTVLAFQPAARGRTVRWTGSLDEPHSTAYLPDIARAYTVLGTSDAADGRAWILPHAPAVTGREFLLMVNRAQHERLKAARMTRLMLRLAAPFNRSARETLGIIHQWDSPWQVDDQLFQKTFGPFPVTPLEQAVHETIQWYRDQPS